MAKKDSAASARKYLSQSDVPAYSLEDALRVARAIGDNYAFGDTLPLKVAQALNMAPNSGPFRMLCGASTAYGLTEGGAFAESIKVLPLGKRILRPLEEGDDLAARREALLQPRIFGEFLRKYDGSPLPREDIARNILSELGAPLDKTGEVLTSILEGAGAVGFIVEIKGKQYVDLSGVKALTPGGAEPQDDEMPPPIPNIDETVFASKLPVEVIGLPPDLGNRKHRVYVAHGKNTELIDPIKKLLSFGELDAIVSTEKQTVSQPVPDKVMADMRACGAAIIHVDDEITLISKDAKEILVLNPNVLIEIGAAIALYGRRFILLVKEGLALPSNLQGLYEVRYRGDTLDGDATIRLLEAINDIKNHPLPGEANSPL